MDFSRMDTASIQQYRSELSQAFSDVESAMATARIYHMDSAYDSLKDAREAYDDAILEADKALTEATERETREWSDENLFFRP